MAMGEEVDFTEEIKSHKRDICLSAVLGFFQKVQWTFQSAKLHKLLGYKRVLKDSTEELCIF